MVDVVVVHCIGHNQHSIIFSLPFPNVVDADDCPPGDVCLGSVGVIPAVLPCTLDREIGVVLENKRQS